MEFVTATFQAALDQSDKIVRHVLKYVVNHRAQINELGESIEQLETDIKRVQCDIEAAKRNLQKTDADNLKEWSDGAKEMIEEAEKIIFEHEEKMMCCNGRCPNLISRYRLSKKACQKKSNLEKIKGEIPTIVIKVGSDGPIGGMGNALSTRGYMEFKSRKSVCDEVVGALEDGNVRMVGVFGMAGSGKTMLVKKIAEQAKQKGLFDVVIVTVVSETPNFKNIQDQIAENLGLNLFGGNQDVRADRLHERLKDEKKTLIILDDIWKRSGLDMNALGISFGNDQKGCKLLLTSRDQCVLSNDLNIKKIFGVDPLEPEDAMLLFKERVGKFDPKFEKTVGEAVAECRGVPLAITAVANALKKKSPDDWSGAVQKLRTSGMDGPHDPVSSAIKLSYDCLESKEEQLLFLLCSLHAEDQEINIDDLLRYGVGYVQSDIYDVGLGVFQGAYTMEQARASLNASIKSLKDCCLLLDGNDGGTIKMHDVTRDAAIKVAKEKFIFIVKEALDLERRSKSKDLIAFSLPYGYVGEHLERLVCPQLKLFFLFNIKNSLQIPDGFFEEIKELSVLSLNGIRLSLRDSSLQFLQNLQTLCLVGCELDNNNIAVIGELKDLKVLSLAWSNIERLPKETGNLHRLQLLDLGNCSQLQVIESNALSGLKRLNELYIENSFNQWLVEEQNASGSYARVSELNHLSHLTTLNIHIPNARIVPDALCFKNLVRYKILIGDDRDWKSTGFEISTLKINIDGRFQLEDGIKTLLKKCEDLCLGEMKGVDKILYKDCEGFPKLKCLDIKKNADIQYIIYSKEPPQIAFPILGSMFLRNMIKLEKIFNRDIDTGFSLNLRKVHIEGCDGLKFVFYVSTTLSLLRLQEMVIRKCKEMDAVVKGSEQEIVINDYTMKFTQLRILELRFLPKLICFSNNFDSESIDHPLFNEKVAFPILETLDIYEIDHLKMIWHDQLKPDSFCKLKELYITECKSLEKCFLPNTLRTLRSLEKLRMSNCQSTEEVFAMRGIDVQDTGDTVQLKYLDLQNLQNLKYIWGLDRGAIFTFKNLYEVKVVDCNGLKCLFPASVAKDLEQLTLLEIYQCGVEEVVEKEELETSESNFAFPRLTFLRLAQLPELKSFYGGKCELRCPLLRELKICNCDKLKIFGSEDTSQQTPFFIDKHTFPNLEELTLKWDATLNNTYGRFPNEFFCGLKFLELNGAPFEEICPYFSEEEQHSATFEHLTKLKLRKMPRLKYIWMDSSQPFIKLQKLVVSECDRLGTFVPSSTFFKNLKKLKVSKCQQLISLLTPSTVKSLLQLKKMVIFECERMTEVVANQGSEGDEITFSQLKSLELRCLHGLTNFHSGNCKIIFPSLEKLTVIGCPQLKIFSEEVSAPKLKGVEIAK